MLYLESPAGSSDPIGFSYCVKGGKPAAVCSWNDVSQAEAYAHTLKAFYAAFPAFAQNDLYLSGESYAGQYIPNIANYIVNDASTTLPLKGILVGNGCW
jgi:carboxypeptidase C (cathepsin A)